MKSWEEPLSSFRSDTNCYAIEIAIFEGGIHENPIHFFCCLLEANLPPHAKNDKDAEQEGRDFPIPDETEIH